MEGHWALPQNRRSFWRPLAGVAGVSSTVAIAVAYFFRRAAEPCIAGACRWCCGILARCGSGVRDFDRAWSRGAVACRRRVMAATIAANLLGDRNIWNSLSSAVANAGEAVIVAGLVHRFCGSPFELNELRKVLALFAATVVATSASGVAGRQALCCFTGRPRPRR